MRGRLGRALAGPPSPLTPPGMLHRPKYSRFRNESLSSLEESKEPGASPPCSPAPAGPHPLSTFLPRLAQLRLSGPAALLALRGFPRAARELPPMKAEPGPQKGSAMQVAGRPDSGQCLRSGEPADRAAKGSQQRRESDLNSGVLYTVRYMGCVEVLQSMRSLDFNTRTQVTREAISRVCEAVPDAKAAMRKRKPPSKELSTVLGKSNLQFAGMKMIMCISVNSLSLMIPDSKQFIANHHMQSVSFASGGDPDTSNYVAYVAKDPVNQRACHILECFDDLARCVINSIGQAFELRFKQYLKNPHAASKPHNESRSTGFALWNVGNDQQNHGYYNEVPGKLASPTGLQKARVNEDSVIQSNSNQMMKDGNISQTAHTSPITIYENYSNLHNPMSTGAGKIISQSDLFDDPTYMNTQNAVNPHSSTMMGVSGQGSANVHRDMYNAISQNNAAAKSPAVGPTPATPSSMREQLVKEIWYCGRMSRQEAEKLLINDGDFLVRESMTTSGQYVLTGLQGGRAKHLLLVDPEGMVRTKDHIFDSVSHLISYHVDNRLPIISSGSELYLKKPV